MSYCQQIGKDRIIFATREDHSKPSTVVLGEEPRDQSMSGLILPSGDINWNCPCLGGMASGPCGYQFREAFSCFHYSSSDSKGEECIDKFAQMQDCMTQYPNLYPNSTTDPLATDDNDQPFPSTTGQSTAIESINGQKSETNGSVIGADGAGDQQPAAKSASNQNKS